jgi:two-component system KDP operon response regulator KdpE
MSNPFSILVVDDEIQIQRFLRHALEAAGYSVVMAGNGNDALAVLEKQNTDLIILDLGLPGLDGKLVLGQLRQTSEIPVIVLSARNDEVEKISSFDIGANDYVEKPFGIGELLARVRALLRPKIGAPHSDNVIVIGNLKIDVDAHTVSRNTEGIRLTPTEFELLTLLARNSGRVLTHRQILTKIWGPAHAENLAYLRVFIGQLRQKVEDNPAEPALIQTVPGIGYKAQ